MKIYRYSDGYRDGYRYRYVVLGIDIDIDRYVPIVYCRGLRRTIGF